MDKEALAELYQAGLNAGNDKIVTALAAMFDTSERSIISTLSCMGIYQKKVYRDKRGNLPIKKEEHIDTLAGLLDVPAETVESLAKANKKVLVLLINALRK
jgi:hypothetical protein